MDPPRCEVRLARLRQREASFTTAIDVDDLPSVLELKRDDPVWEELGKKCLCCGSCSMVCPTCTCFTVRDEVPEEGRAVRVRTWDACLSSNYALVAGGPGMVPLRGLLQYLIDLRDRFGRITLLYGTRAPELVLFREELESLSRRGDAEIVLSVDSTQGRPWAGRVGVVTELLDQVQLDVEHTYAVACGPPVFYKFMLEKLVKAGFAKDRIFLSLERRMEFGIGKCGHCAVGYPFTCLHGPVFSYWDAINLPEPIYT